MKVIKSIPRGYCHGVINAINLVTKTVKENKNEDIYLWGEIVHNKNITQAFEEIGVKTLKGNSRKEMLAQVNNGILIITAHGIDETLIEQAQKKGLKVINATCADVIKTHKIIKSKISQHYEVLFIGKLGHPETEGVVAISDHINLITCKDDIDHLNLKGDKIAITNQTTMSKYDTYELFKYAKEKYPNLTIIDEICSATSSRQEIALQNSKNADLTIVVGDRNSNNTTKLVNISKNMGNCKAYQIENIEQLDIQWLLDKNVNTIHITSGASTPSIITKEVIQFIENFHKDDETTWDTTSKIDILKIIPRIK